MKHKTAIEKVQLINYKTLIHCGKFWWIYSMHLHYENVELLYAKYITQKSGMLCLSYFIYRYTEFYNPSLWTLYTVLRYRFAHSIFKMYSVVATFVWYSFVYLLIYWSCLGVEGKQSSTFLYFVCSKGHVIINPLIAVRSIWFSLLANAVRFHSLQTEPLQLMCWLRLCNSYLTNFA